MKPLRVRRGRRPHLTLAAAIAIVDELRRGGSLTGAARSAGLDCGTLRRWLRRGRAGVQPYVELAAIVDPLRERRRT